MKLVRHGESQWNRIFGATRVDPGLEDPSLTDIGVEQAMTARDRIKGLNIGRIITSPYKRTLQTAQILQEVVKCDIEIDLRVRERRVFSCDIGSRPEELRSQWPKIDFSGLDEYWWGKQIESMTRFDARCSDFIRAMNVQNEFDRTLVVTHWGFIRAVTGQAVGNAQLVGLP